MPTTTPDNLRSPDLGVPYNIIPDMATLATDVQTALERRANAYKGTAAQRIAFTTATTGVTWKDTDATRMPWVKLAAGWAPGVNGWYGTLAERGQLTNVPVGFSWYNTANSVTEYFSGTAWQAGELRVELPVYPSTTYNNNTGAVWDRVNKFATISINATRTVWTSGGATAFAAVPYDCRPQASKGVVISWSGAAAPFVSFGLIAADGTVTAYGSPTNGQSWTASVSVSYALP